MREGSLRPSRFGEKLLQNHQRGSPNRRREATQESNWPVGGDEKVYWYPSFKFTRYQTRIKAWLRSMHLAMPGAR
jgi:hypothetical protein